MKTAVIYYSKHHGNTKKILDVLCKDNEIHLIDATKTEKESLAEYDLIGFASGIYYSKFHKSVLKFAEANFPEGKSVFFLYTYGAKKEGYTKAIQETVLKKSAHVLGEFGCFGFNTFGPFKLIGGLAKGHPNETECEQAKQFFAKLVK